MTEAGVSPELHPLDYEWYFSSDTISKLLSLCAAGPVLALGTPTVANALARQNRDVLLVDRNRLISRRFPEIAAQRALLIHDLNDARVRVSPARTVILDPPWYPAEFRRWIWQAALGATRGGSILLPLFPESTRPSAERERQDLIGFASQVGPVTVHAGALEYDTPRFEIEAGLAIGQQSGGLRAADLVHVQVERTDIAEPPRLAPEAAWGTYVIGPQVIKLRREPTGDPAGPIVQPLRGCPDLVLRSVSRRDPIREQVDVWTSRNRVARVGSYPVIASALRSLTKKPSARPAGVLLALLGD